MQSERKWSIKQYFEFWLLIFITNLAVYMLTSVIGWSNYSAKQIFIKSIPWKSNLWYIQAYLGLILMIPILNITVEKWWNEKQTLFVITILSIVPLLYETDVFAIKNGYSTIWLCTLYIIGGIIRKQSDRGLLNIKLWTLMILVAIFTALVFGSKWLPEWNTFQDTGEYKEMGTWFVYSSPSVLLQAICTFLLFLKVKKNAPKWFVHISGASLGVYLIHKHPVINTKFVVNCSNELATHNTGEMLLGVSGLIVSIFICSLVASIIITNLTRTASKKVTGIGERMITSVFNRRSNT